ncbi:MAG: hypothetical protein KBA46_05795 [Candidatus Omnitrophica bacterium]|nr:hypothetical protein [Candidatus Omnitrophota bacterium]
MTPFPLNVRQVQGKSAALLCLFFLVSMFLSEQSVFAASWDQVSSDHFIIHYTGDDRFARDVSGKAELYYERIARELGYPRYSEFWTWDKRVKIYIFPDHASFIKATNQPQWSHGLADYKNKEILSYAWSREFTESLLPHEIAHLIFRDFVGFKGEVPLWLDEGVAQWAEEPKRSQVKMVIKKLFNEDAVLSFADMMGLDIRKIDQSDKVYIRATKTKENEPGVLFLSGDNLINTYYIQAVSLVAFLIDSYGSLSFASFCRELREGKSLEEGLRSAYSPHLKTLDEFEKKWREYVSK